MTRRIAALLCCAAALLGLLCVCKKKNATVNIYEDFTPTGTLYCYLNGAVELIYDDEGKALQLSGTNEIGKQLTSACIHMLGSKSEELPKAMLSHAIQNNLLGQTKTMVLRVGSGDPLPYESMLTDIADQCQQLAAEKGCAIRVFAVNQNMLTKDDLLGLDIAKQIATVYLGEGEISGDAVPANGVYSFTANGKSCTVDAFSGVVTMK